MLVRLATVTAAALACAACANDTSSPSRFGAGAPPAMHLVPPAHAADDMGLKKTYASRVLSAIALEKVTGRKPDPQRLMELD